MEFDIILPNLHLPNIKKYRTFVLDTVNLEQLISIFNAGTFRF